jgi:hypothetical protein
MAEPMVAVGNRSHDVLRLSDIDVADVESLLARYGLELVRVADGEPIPGSFWGESEAGLIAFGRSGFNREAFRQGHDIARARG